MDLKYGDFKVKLPYDGKKAVKGNVKANFKVSEKVSVPAGQKKVVRLQIAKKMIKASFNLDGVFYYPNGVKKDAHVEGTYSGPYYTKDVVAVSSK